MNHFSKKDIQGLLKKYKVHPSKGLGQNFLVDKKALGKIVAAANIKKEDVVLEIGSGTGILTQELAKRAKKVIAVEKDYKMVEILKETTRNFKNVEIIQGDILKLNSKSYKLQTKRYKVVANLPYYIVSPVLKKFLENENQPKEMILMVQKEVGQRIAAKPPDMSLLAVSVQFYADSKIISYVSRKSFWPQPKVDSAILRIVPQINAGEKLINADLFFRIVRAGFSHPRKQIINNLSKSLKINREKIESWLQKNGIQPERRAETLDLQEWLQLIKTSIFD